MRQKVGSWQKNFGIVLVKNNYSFPNDWARHCKCDQMWCVKRICVFEHSVMPILTAYAQPFRGARDLAFCLKVPRDSLLVWVRSEGSGETARMRRLAWTFAARKGDEYQIRLTRPSIPFENRKKKYMFFLFNLEWSCVCMKSKQWLFSYMRFFM